MPLRLEPTDAGRPLRSRACVGLRSCTRKTFPGGGTRGIAQANRACYRWRKGWVGAIFRCQGQPRGRGPARGRAPEERRLLCSRSVRHGGFDLDGFRGADRGTCRGRPAMQAPTR